MMDRAEPIRPLILLWVVSLSAKLLYVAIAFGFEHSGHVRPLLTDAQGMSQVVLAVAALLALLATNAAKLLSSHILQPIEALDEKRVVQRVMRVYLMRCALYESPAVMGLAVFFLNGNIRVFSVFAAYSLALDLFNMPSRARLAGWARAVHPRSVSFSEEAEAVDG